MNVSVVYDSFFGNTEKLATVIAQSLEKNHQVNLVKASDMTLDKLNGVEVLIVGSPTRAFRPTPLISRFLNSIPPQGLRGVKVAAFDTGIAPSDIKSSFLRFVVTKAGYAAKPIADLLIKKGGLLLVPPAGFYVIGNEGPLKEGELERASSLLQSVSELH